MRKLLIFLCLFSVFSFAQERSRDTVRARQARHLNIGTFVFGATLTGYYEHMLVDKIQDRDLGIFMRTGGGLWMVWGATQALVTAQLGILSKVNKKHHFEAAMGPAFLLPDMDSWEFPPLALNTGYRYQKPSGGFIFRVGASWPEGVYLGFGKAF